MKIGRNDPCPCGSGKKYKKCCLPRHENAASFLGSNDLQTGTLLDGYQILFKSVAFFGQALREADDNKEEKEELNAAYADFECDFKPGTPHGVSNGMFLSWLYFDFRFGAHSKTIIERFIAEGLAEKLEDPGPVMVEDMAVSYLTFYEVVSVGQEKIGLKELVTNRLFQMVCTEDTFEADARAGDIWYIRLVGPDDDEVYGFTAPLMFLPESREFFERMVEKQVRVVSKMFPRKIKKSEKDMLFIFACKQSTPFWAKYFVESGPREEEPFTEPGPALVNMDQERLHLCRVYFQVKNKREARKRLDAFSGIERDETDDAWIWFKKAKSKAAGDRVVGGRIIFEKGCLVAETNSIRRALRLKRLLQKALGDSTAYRKIDAHSPEAMPGPSLKEMQDFEDEQRRMNDDPEVQAFLRKRLHDYYHKSWVRQKIPALGGLTPYQAAKTPEGRSNLSALFDYMERLNAAGPSKEHKFDFTELKKKLGVR